MKNLFILFVIIFSIKLYSQENQKEKQTSKVSLDKYKKQYKIANTLSISGGVLLFTGIIISQQKSKPANLVFSKNEVTGYSIATVGILSIISSIPIYISAEKNHKKSIQITPSVNNYNFNSKTT